MRRQMQSSTLWREVRLLRNSYYSMAQEGTEANINIYGDITSWAREELGEMSVVNLSRKLDELDGVSKINVYINSYGGEVAEGLAIYNSLKRHPAQVTTYCDGFACSIASVIFMAGDKRVMNEASLLMIHNAWTWAQGNPAELRKVAEDLEKITDASVAAYMSKAKISEEKIREMMDAETWISPADAVEYGLATSVKKEESDKPSQNARKKVYEMILCNPYQAVDDEEETEEPENPETEEPETDEEPETGTEEEPEEPEDEEAEEAASDEEEDAEEEPEAEDSEDEEDEAMETQSAFFRAIQHM